MTSFVDKYESILKQSATQLIFYSLFVRGFGQGYFGNNLLHQGQFLMSPPQQQGENFHFVGLTPWTSTQCLHHHRHVPKGIHHHLDLLLSNLHPSKKRLSINHDGDDDFDAGPVRKRHWSHEEEVILISKPMQNICFIYMS